MSNLVTKPAPDFKAQAVASGNSFVEIKLNDQGGIGHIGYPLVADLTKSISRDYGVLVDDAVALRGLFLIDKDGIIRHAVINDLPLGRNVDEVLRVLDALQFTEKYGDVCPAIWRAGEKAMKPAAEGVAQYLAGKHSGDPAVQEMGKV